MLKKIKDWWNKGEGYYDPLENPLKETSVPASITIVEPFAEVPDGKAEFLGEGTHEEFLEQEKDDKGLSGIFGI